MFKKKTEEIDYTKKFKIGEFYKLETGSIEERDKMFGVYYCKAKDDKCVYFDSFFGYFFLDEFIVSSILKNDDWPKHIDGLLEMEIIQPADYPEIFKKLMDGIFRGEEDV